MNRKNRISLIPFEIAVFSIITIPIFSILNIAGGLSLIYVEHSLQK